MLFYLFKLISLILSYSHFFYLFFLSPISQERVNLVLIIIWYMLNLILHPH